MRCQLPSNTPQKASHRAKNECNTHVAPSGAEEYGESMFLYTCRPSGAKILYSCMLLVERIILTGIMARY